MQRGHERQLAGRLRPLEDGVRQDRRHDHLPLPPPLLTTWRAAEAGARHRPDTGRRPTDRLARVRAVGQPGAHRPARRRRSATCATGKPGQPPGLVASCRAASGGRVPVGLLAGASGPVARRPIHPRRTLSPGGPVSDSTPHGHTPAHPSATPPAPDPASGPATAARPLPGSPPTSGTATAAHPSPGSPPTSGPASDARPVAGAAPTSTPSPAASVTRRGFLVLGGVATASVALAGQPLPSPATAARVRSRVVSAAGGRGAADGAVVVAGCPCHAQ
ncbi:twin-arginine translocation signal domain-containing protein [Nonomuraea salmonea]|uniref:twin-arginine translocation signal domain-containing protein n=1 Tax=Nonomuraea salmonea TaxID=46181 RepID=UPI00361BF86B